MSATTGSERPHRQWADRPQILGESPASDTLLGFAAQSSETNTFPQSVLATCVRRISTIARDQGTDLTTGLRKHRGTVPARVALLRVPVAASRLMKVELSPPANAASRSQVAVALNCDRSPIEFAA